MNQQYYFFFVTKYSYISCWKNGVLIDENLSRLPASVPATGNL